MGRMGIQNNKARTIILSIETKVREFPGKVLLACFLAERGFRVILSNDRKYNKVVKEKAWLFIDRNTFASRKVFFKNLRRNNTDIACLDEEGIVWATPEIYLRRLNKEVMDKTSLFFTWGKKQTDLVNQIKTSTIVLETGNPRMDLLRPELRDIYKDQIDDLQGKYRDFVLIVSNFGWVNHFYSDSKKGNTKEEFLGLLRYQGHIQTEADEKFHLDNLDYKAKVFEEFKKMVLFLGKELPDVTIIVRPHPSENHETWKQALRECSNIKVLFEGELEPWIMAARSVIHNSCTSGILASLVNRKSIAYLPYQENQFEHEFPNSISAKAFTLEEVLDLVKKSPLSQEIPETVKEYISALTGPLATERIADAILDFYNERINNTSRFSVRIALNKLILQYKSIRKIIRKSRKFKENREDYKKQKLDSLNSGEVEDCVSLYKRLLNRFEDVESRNIDNTVEITVRKK